MLKRPRLPRKYLNSGDERNCVGDLLRYFIDSGRAGSTECALYTRRFGTILSNDGLDDGSIMLQHHWALLYEVLKDSPRAIRHLEREVEILEHLFETYGPIETVNYTFIITEMRKLHGNYVAVGKTELASALFERIAEHEQRESTDAGSDSL